MRFFNDMEKVIRDNGERGLEMVEYYYGVELELYRLNTKQDIYSKVHGKNAGKTGQLADTIVGVLVSDDFFVADDMFTGGFELGFLYTRTDNVKTGDTLKVVSEDGKQRRFKVESKEDIGITSTVFEKWKLSNLGD